MKVKIRRTTPDDLESVYKLHCKCFSVTDCWYRTAIRDYLDKGLVIELVNERLIIGVLLQGKITPCNQKMTIHVDSSEYKEDIFEPLTENGIDFFNNNNHYKSLNGIVMICIDPDYRGRGLAKILIKKHWKHYNSGLVCLNTRKSNLNAFMLYKSMGYEHIAYIKNKYILPTEDSIFMIKNL